jgi:hypothetical protein
MPGTMGLSDLYSVAISGDDNYGVPVNLGFPINTEARETFLLGFDNIYILPVMDILIGG